jgi:hypothetical protein
MKLIFGRTTFIPRFCVFLSHPNDFGVLSYRHHPPQLPNVTTTLRGMAHCALAGDRAVEGGVDGTEKLLPPLCSDLCPDRLNGHPAGEGLGPRHHATLLVEHRASLLVLRPRAPEAVSRCG